MQSNSNIAEHVLSAEITKIAKHSGETSEKLNALFKSVAKLVAHIGHGGISEEQITRGMLTASYENGLCPGELESAVETIKIAIRAGCVVAELPDGLDSEFSAAQGFIQAYGHDFRYCEESATWYTWTGNIWKTIKTSQHFHEVGKFVGTLGLKTLSKAKAVEGILKFVGADPRVGVSREDLDVDHLLLGTPDGVLDLTTGKLRPALRADLITKTCAVIPIQMPTPKWDAFLQEATANDPNLQEYLQRIAGYCLTGLTLEQCLFFFYGEGGRGKGTFVNTLAYILKDYAAQATMETFMDAKFERHSTDVAMLSGARMVTASETKAGHPWDEAKIKTLTGRDPITARFMRQDNFTFIPKFKLVFLGNHAPIIRNVDEAMKRRLNIVPFDTIPATVNKQLMDELQAEWPGILQWAVEGCLKWQVDGLKRPDIVETRTEEYFEDQDLFDMWLQECTMPALKDKYNTPTNKKGTMLSVAYMSWTAFCDKYNKWPGPIQSFTTLLERKGFKRTGKIQVGGTRSRVIQGLIVKGQPSIDLNKLLNTPL